MIFTYNLGQNQQNPSMAAAAVACCFRHFWVILGRKNWAKIRLVVPDHFWPFWLILGHSRSFWVVSGDFWSFLVILALFGPSGTFLAFLGHFGIF